jgi:two-component system phosphate regulon sensor histidine kinase PhoR
VLVARAAGGRPLVAYGVGVDPEAYLAPVLAGVLAKPRLLPPALTSAPAGRPAAPAGAGATAAALPAAPAPLALRVRDGAGRPLYASPAPFAWRYHAAEVLDDAYGGLRVDVALDPAVAEAAVPGGSPEAPLPVPLALFALTAGLIAVAVLQLRRQDELARMRADFVSGVSHELRTPLAQIRLLAELLHLGRPAHEEGRQRAARVIDQEARRLSYLVENVLAFSRGERGATRLVTAPLDVAEAAAEVVELFAPLAAAAGVRVVLRAEPGAVASVDGGALRQVLLNFLDNAARYGPRGQTVEVGVARAAAPGGGVCVRVWVQDEGPGVPPAERARVWAPYYRLERDAAATRGGSGIGLAVVRDLVARQGGAVRVEAATRANAAGGRGARFVAEFPAPPPGARPEAAAAAPPAPTDYLRARLRERTPVHTAAAPRPAPNVAPGAGAGAGA